MDPTANVPAPPRVRLLEILLIGVALILMLAAELWCASLFRTAPSPAAQPNGGSRFPLLSHHFWLDEFYTYTLVADPSAPHALRALASGFEKHPPTYYLLLRGFAALIGRCDEPVPRGFSALSMVLAFVGLYALLRLAFSPLVCFAALVVMWCQALIVLYTFEARFYAPWLAAVTWFAYVLVMSRSTIRPLTCFIALAICSVLVCTMHYLGILAFALILAAELGARRRHGLPLFRGLVAAATGPLATAACIPLALAQKSASSVATWMPPPTLETLGYFFVAFLYFNFLLPLILIGWLAHLLARKEHTLPAKPEYVRWDVYAGVTALLAMPLVIALLSFAVQSLLVPRYAFPAVAAFAPAFALAMRRMSPAWLIFVCGAYFIVGTAQLNSKSDDYLAEDDKTERLIATLRRDTGHDLVAFESPATLYIVCRYAPDLRSRCVLLDFELGDIDSAYVNQGRVFGRDAARRFHEFYKMPRLEPWSQVKRLPRIFLVPATFEGAQIHGLMKAPYHGFVVRRLSQDLYEMFPSPLTQPSPTNSPTRP